MQWVNAASRPSAMDCDVEAGELRWLFFPRPDKRLFWQGVFSWGPSLYHITPSLLGKHLYEHIHTITQHKHTPRCPPPSPQLQQPYRAGPKQFIHLHDYHRSSIRSHTISCFQFPSSLRMTGDGTEYQSLDSRLKNNFINVWVSSILMHPASYFKGKFQS